MKSISEQNIALLQTARSKDGAEDMYKVLTEIGRSKSCPPLLRALMFCREIYKYDNNFAYERDPFAPLRLTSYADFQNRATPKSTYAVVNAAILLLLERGAALNGARKAGSSVETAMDIALMYADADVAYTLRAAGAKYGYELRGDTTEAERRRRIDPTHPIDLPEPEEWRSVEDILEYARACTALLGLWHWQWTLQRGDFAGVCIRSEFTLSLNPDYLDRPHHLTRTTIIHELAHAMAPQGASHGPIWKLWGAALGQPGMRVPGYILPSPWAYALLMKPSRPET